MTTTKQMIVTAFSKAFNKYFYNELVVGKLAHSEMKESISKGDEVDITMPGVVKLFDYDGGDLPTAEEATISTCKVKIDRGKAFHFELSEMEETPLGSGMECIAPPSQYNPNHMAKADWFGLYYTKYLYFKKVGSTLLTYEKSML